MNKSIDDDSQRIKDILKLADELTTLVISGRAGSVAKALDFARAISEIRRQGTPWAQELVQ
jgi:hypothetical protein